MLVKTMIEWLKELPEDYDIVFSDYVSIVVPEEESETGEEEEYFVVSDDPIRGLLRHDDDKEIRFFTQKSDQQVIRHVENGGDELRYLDTGEVVKIEDLKGN